MSATEDCELQDLVRRTLEKTGSLSKIRAELRASIFLALEENGYSQNRSSKNTELQNFSQNADGTLILCLVKEFLECFGLSFSMSVLDPELASYNVQCSWKNRKELIKELNLPSDVDNEKKTPLMYHILQQLRDYQNNVPISISQNQKDTFRLPFGKMKDTATDYCELAIKTISSNETELIGEKFYEENEHVETLQSRISSEEWKNVTSSIMNGKDAPKSNLTLLGNLPPLSSPPNTGKSNPSPFSNQSSKQMNKLKAMLIDSSSETTNVSTVTDDELLNSIESHDISGLDDLDEKQIGELLKE